MLLLGSTMLVSVQHTSLPPSGCTLTFLVISSSSPSSPAGQILTERIILVCTKEIMDPSIFVNIGSEESSEKRRAQGEEIKIPWAVEGTQSSLDPQ